MKMFTKFLYSLPFAIQNNGFNNKYLVRTYSTSERVSKINKWVNYKLFVDYDLESFKQILFSDNKVKFDFNYALLTKVRKDNKFFTIGTKQLSIIFNSLIDPYIEEIFITIIDRLEILFEEYPTELEYTCDSVLLEFYPIKEVDGKIFTIQNKQEAKEKISNEAYLRGMKAFNILGGFNIEKTASPIIIRKKKFSTLVREFSTVTTFNTENPNLVDFEQRFNNNFKSASTKEKINYEFYETSEVFLTFKNGKDYIVIVDKKDNEIHKRIYNKFAVMLQYVIDVSNNDGTWSRKQGNFNTIFNTENEIIMSEKKIKLTGIPKNLYRNKKKDDKEIIANPNIGTIDLETTSSEKPRCYSIGFYTNLDDKPKIFYIDKDIDSCKLVHSCFEEMMRHKYRNVTFYAHNLGKFDAVFILKELILFNQTPEGKINPYIIPEPLTRNSDILKLVVKRNIDKKTRSVTIMDSLAILPRSLRDLCRDYKVENPKSYFPYEFSIDNNLFYIGKTPSINYYVDIPESEYNNLVKEDWDFKGETLKYLELDLRSLYEVLVKVNKTINLLFDINLTDCATVSSLANKIYLEKFYDDKNKPIPLIKDPIIFNHIHQAYYGGRVEVFNPIINKDSNKTYYYYDVNSLYPAASLNDMPGLNCTYFENVKGILELKDLFGYLYCKIKCSDNRYLGLLPKKTDTSLIFPSGSWEGWYFSEELKLAADNGYEIEIIKGYKFNRISHVFDDFINDVYKIKSNPRNPTEKNVAKLILNSLIGRLGMNIHKIKTSLLSEEKHLELLSTRVVKNTTDLGSGMYLDVYIPDIDKDICTSFNLDFIQILNNENIDEKGINPVNNVSISTAAAVLSYARIHMAKIMLYILENKGTLYYTDTDSIVTDLELPKEMIDGVELGKLKLEHTIEQGYFIADKTYTIINNEGKIIKRAKGVKSSLLKYEDYEKMYNKEIVDANKISSIRNYKDGYVTISNKVIKLNPSSYKKRGRIIENGKWIGTEIININK